MSTDSKTVKSRGRPKASEQIKELKKTIEDLNTQLKESQRPVSSESEETIKEVQSLQTEITELRSNLGEIDDLKKQIEEKDATIQSLTEHVMKLQEEPETDNVEEMHQAVQDFDPRQPCYHANILKSISQITPVSTLNIRAGIKSPENLTQVSEDVLTNNFGMDPTKITDIYLTCEDYTNVYLYKWSDIKHLKLSYKGMQRTSSGYMNYTGK